MIKSSFDFALNYREKCCLMCFYFNSGLIIIRRLIVHREKLRTMEKTHQKAENKKTSFIFRCDINLLHIIFIIVMLGNHKFFFYLVRNNECLILKNLVKSCIKSM